MNAKTSPEVSIASDIDREQREMAHTKLRLLRSQLRVANVARENAVTETRMWCRAARRLAHERDRLRALVALVANTDGARRTAREELSTRKEQIERASNDLHERARAELVSEWVYEEQLGRLERDHRQQRSHLADGLGTAHRSESDDDVRASVPAKLLPFFEQVRGEVDASVRESRTEAFLRFAEAHPERVLASMDGSFDARVADLERRSKEITSALRRRDRTPDEWAIAHWLLDALRQRCSRVTLVQRVDSDTGAFERLIVEWPLANEPDVDMIVEALSRKGRLRQPGLYCLFVYQPGGTIHFDRRTLRVDAPLPRSAPLRPRGGGSALAQALRHAEANAKATVQQSLALIEQYRALVHERDARIAVLERRHLRALPSPNDGEKKP